MKIKKFFFALTIIFILAFIFVSTANAKPESFGNFRAEVPHGWSGGLQGSTLVIKHENGNASLAVAFNKMGEASLTDIAERLYIQMDGRDLEQDDDGDYSFSFVNSAGAESIALLTGGDGYYLVISMSGFEDDALQKDFEKILDSIDWED
ncbi:MAG: hypothetical protein IJT20_07890 [Synergistaceae bacterium]|nr:hypothetical protein [Synergistaceae bacterium]